MGGRCVDVSCSPKVTPVIQIGVVFEVGHHVLQFFHLLTLLWCPLLATRPILGVIQVHCLVERSLPRQVLASIEGRPERSRKRGDVRERRAWREARRLGAGRVRSLPLV